MEGHHDLTHLEQRHSPENKSSGRRLGPGLLSALVIVNLVGADR